VHCQPCICTIPILARRPILSTSSWRSGRCDKWYSREFLRPWLGRLGEMGVSSTALVTSWLSAMMQSMFLQYAGCLVLVCVALIQKSIGKMDGMGWDGIHKAKWKERSWSGVAL
jgi:hypothetical protein